MIVVYVTSFFVELKIPPWFDFFTIRRTETKPLNEMLSLVDSFLSFPITVYVQLRAFRFTGMYVVV